MPRYHFNVVHGTDYVDETGTDLVGIEEARREARCYDGTMLAESGQVYTADREWRLEVTDHMGSALFRLDVSMTDMP